MERILSIVIFPGEIFHRGGFPLPSPENTRRLGNIYLWKITKRKTIQNSSYTNLNYILNIHVNEINVLKFLDNENLKKQFTFNTFS